MINFPLKIPFILFDPLPAVEVSDCQPLNFFNFPFSLPAVLILELMFGFSPPLGAKNQTSAGVSGRRRRPETPADFHNENCCLFA
jgi:hypothetical protein